MNAHPTAALFPMLTNGELAEMVESIQANGLRRPIALLDGMVLDGRNRLRACEIAGVEPRFEDAQLNGMSPVVYVVVENLHRRHLTKSQCAAIAREALPIYQAEAKERQREHGRTAPGRPANTSTTSSGSARHGEARVRAAKDFGVSPSYLAEAEKVGRIDPATLERVKAGDLTVAAATRELGVEHPSKHGCPKVGTEHGRRSGPTLKQSLRGLEQAAMQIQSLAEALDSDLLGDWSRLYDTPDADRAFDAIEQYLPVLNARVKRALRDRTRSHGAVAAVGR